MTAFLAFVACKQTTEFHPAEFIALSGQYFLLTEKEQSIAEINVGSIPKPDIRSTARVCKKIAFQTTTAQLNLDLVNPDSNFSYLKFFREQLFQRSQPNPKGAIFIHNTDTAKEQYGKFLRVLFEKKDISSSQYAKITEKLKREPVVYPFLVYEWIETMP